MKNMNNMMTSPMMIPTAHNPSTKMTSRSFSVMKNDVQNNNFSEENTDLEF